MPLLALRPVAAGLALPPVGLEHLAAVALGLPATLQLGVAVPVLELGHPLLAVRLVEAAVVGRASAAVEQRQSTQ